MAAETIIVRGRRVLVSRPRSFASAARGMAAAGWPAARICAALACSPRTLERALAAPTDGIWGGLAEALANEMRRAG